MEIIVVTGLRKNNEEIDKCLAQLEADGYQRLDNQAGDDSHPMDIAEDVNNLIDFLHDHCAGQKFCMKTNSDHVINALRVLKFKKKVDVFKAIHFGESGIAEEANCEDDGEMNRYPDGFLDEWPNLMGQLL